MSVARVFGSWRPQRRPDAVANRRDRHEHQHDEEQHGQQKRSVDPLLLVGEVHEHASDHRALHGRNDERDGDGDRDAEMELVGGHGNARKHQQRQAVGGVAMWTWDTTANNRRASEVSLIPTRRCSSRA